MQHPLTWAIMDMKTFESKAINPPKIMNKESDDEDNQSDNMNAEAAANEEDENDEQTSGPTAGACWNTQFSAHSSKHASVQVKKLNDLV